MAWSEEDIVRELAKAGTNGLTTTALAKAISSPPANKQLSSAISKLKSRGAVRGPFRMGRLSLFFEAKSAPTREQLESRIEELLRHAGMRVTTRSDLDKGMKGVVQSLYKDAISALKAEGKIVELRNAKRSPLYVHREAIIDQLRVESGGDSPRGAATAGRIRLSASITLDDLRPVYETLKAQQGGISGVRIYDVLQHLTASKQQLHDLLRRERLQGRVTLHVPSSVNTPQEVMEAGVKDDGEPYPFVTFVILD